MSVFILTVIANEVLDCIEVFDNFDDARTAAEKLIRKHNRIPVSRFVTQMNAWVFADYESAADLERDSLFVAVTLRTVHGKNPTHSDLSQQIFAKPVAGISTDINASETPAADILPALSLDNPTDPSLPGGFDFADKPLTLDWIINHPIDAKPISYLSDNQKWALVIARIAKRPHVVFSFEYDYNQAQTLELLKKKSPIGLKIRDLELNDLQLYINSLNSSWDDEDYSSSSSEDSW